MFPNASRLPLPFARGRPHLRLGKKWAENVDMKAEWQMGSPPTIGSCLSLVVPASLEWFKWLVMTGGPDPDDHESCPCRRDDWNAGGESGN